MSKKKSSQPLTEEQQQIRRNARSVKFRKLAVQRMTKALKVLRQIGNLANRQSYVYSGAEADHIVNTLAERVKMIQTAFNGMAEQHAGFTINVPE